MTEPLVGPAAPALPKPAPAPVTPPLPAPTQLPQQLGTSTPSHMTLLKHAEDPGGEIREADRR